MSKLEKHYTIGNHAVELVGNATKDIHVYKKKSAEELDYLMFVQDGRVLFTMEICAGYHQATGYVDDVVFREVTA